MDMIGGPTMRMRREIFVESVLHAIIESIDSPEENDGFWTKSGSARSNIWPTFLESFVVL